MMSLTVYNQKNDTDTKMQKENFCLDKKIY